MSLRPGMTATAVIAATERQGVLLVPNAALRYSPSAAPAASSDSGLLSKLMPRPPGASTPKRAGASKTAAGAARQLWLLKNGQSVAVNVTTGQTTSAAR